MNKFDTYQNIERRINTLINQAVKNLPKSTPCKVVEVKAGNRVKVKRMNLNNNIIGLVDDVPIIRPIYCNYPINIGDVGVLLTSDYPVSGYVENSNLPESELRLNSDGAGYLFLPLAPTDKDMNKEKNNGYEIYSLDGKTLITINNEKIEITDDDKNTILINKDGFKIVDANENTIDINKDGYKLVDANKNEITYSSDGIKIIDKNKNEVVLNSSGIVIKDSNNNEISTSATSINIKSGANKFEMGPAGVSINGSLEVLP